MWKPGGTKYSKQMISNREHHFSCSAIPNALVNKFTPKNLEERFIVPSQICCISLRMELRSFNVNEFVSIPHRRFILTLCVVIF